MTELFIEGKRMELSSDTLITQNFQVNDMAEIKYRDASYTDRFKIPMTPKNVMLMNFAGVAGNTSDRPYKKLRAKLVVGGIELISKGWCRVLAMENNHYEVAVYSGIIHLYDKIEGKKITDLSLGNLNHKTLDADKFTASWDNEQGYIYALANFREGATRLSDYQKENGVDYNFQLPSVYVHTLWDKIFQEAGFSYSGEVFEDEEFKSEVLAVCQNRWTDKHGDSGQATKDANIGCASITPVERIEPIEYGEVIYIKLEKSQGKGCNNTSDIILGSATSTDSFVVNYTGGITINIDFDIRFLEGEYGDVNKKNLKTLYLELTRNQLFYKRHDLDKNKAKQTVSLSDMPMEKGDYVDLQIRFETRTARSIYIARGRGVTGSVSFEKTSPAGPKGWFLFEDMLPGISQKDFIRDIMQRYGLIFKEDGQKDGKPHYTFMRIEDLFKRAKATERWGDKYENWSDKFVRLQREDYSLSNEYGQNNHMKYRYSDDYPDSRYNKALIKEKFLEHEFDGNIQTKDNETPKFENELFGSPYTIDSFRILYIYNSDTFKTISPVSFDNPIEQASAVKDMPIWNVPVISKDGKKFRKTDAQIFRVIRRSGQLRIGFGDGSYKEVDKQTPFLSRYNMGYQHFVDRHYNRFRQVLKRQKKLTAWFRLDSIDIYQLDFFKLKYISQLGRYCYLNKVEQFTGKGLTRCELIELPAKWEEDQAVFDRLMKEKKDRQEGLKQGQADCQSKGFYDMQDFSSIAESKRTPYQQGYMQARAACPVPPKVKAQADESYVLQEQEEAVTSWRSLNCQVTKGTYPVKTYKWELLSKPAEADTPVIEDASSQNTRFRFDKVSKISGVYQFKVTVCDDHGYCQSDTCSISIDIFVSPIVKAQSDRRYSQEVGEDESSWPLHCAVIKGTYPIKSYYWEYLGTGNARIWNGSSQNTSFHLRNVLHNSDTYVFKITVCDDHGNCSSDTCKVTLRFWESDFDKGLRRALEDCDTCREKAYDQMKTFSAEDPGFGEPGQVEPREVEPIREPEESCLGPEEREFRSKVRNCMSLKEYDYNKSAEWKRGYNKGFDQCMDRPY